MLSQYVTYVVPTIRRLRKIQSVSDAPALQLTSSRCGELKVTKGKLTAKQRRREVEKLLDLEAAVSGR
jgi:hypothetical protein